MHFKVLCEFIFFEYDIECKSVEEILKLNFNFNIIMNIKQEYLTILWKFY